MLSRAKKHPLKSMGDYIPQRVDKFPSSLLTPKMLPLVTNKWRRNVCVWPTHDRSSLTRHFGRIRRISLLLDFTEWR